MLHTFLYYFLTLCEKTNNFLLLKRCKIASNPLTWSIVSGGIEEGESVLEGIKRELMEETQIPSTNIRYEFFEHQELQFISDPDDSYSAAQERRERRRKESLRDMLWTPKEDGGLAEEAPTGDPAGDNPIESL